MSLLAPRNFIWSIVGLVIGGIVGYLLTNMNEPELAIPGALVGAVVGLLLGGLLRTLLGKH